MTVNIYLTDEITGEVETFKVEDVKRVVPVKGSPYKALIIFTDYGVFKYYYDNFEIEA